MQSSFTEVQWDKLLSTYSQQTPVLKMFPVCQVEGRQLKGVDESFEEQH